MKRALNRVNEAGARGGRGVRPLVPLVYLSKFGQDRLLAFMMIRIQLLFLSLMIVLCPPAGFGRSRLQDQIHGKIEPVATAVVRGNVHPLANARYDQPAPACLPLEAAGAAFIFRNPTGRRRAVFPTIMLAMSLMFL